MALAARATRQRGCRDRLDRTVGDATQFSLICRITGRPATSAPATIASACSIPITLNATAATARRPELPRPAPQVPPASVIERPARGGAWRSASGSEFISASFDACRCCRLTRPEANSSPPARRSVSAAPSAAACRSKSGHSSPRTSPSASPATTASPAPVAFPLTRSPGRASQQPSPPTASSPSTPSETTTNRAPAPRQLPRRRPPPTNDSELSRSSPERHRTSPRCCRTVAVRRGSVTSLGLGL